MKRVIFTFMFLFSLVLSACGTSNQDVANDQGETNGSGGIVAGEVETSLIEKDSLQYEYRLKNQTEEEIILEFPTSQRYDYTISTKDGTEKYRYSSTATFIQVEETETLKQGDELIYEINLSDIQLEKGEYVLSVWTTTKEGEKFKVVTDIKFDSSINLNEIISTDAVFNGQADPHTIEVTIDGEAVSLQTLEVTDVDFSKIETGANISIQYYANELGQNVLTSFTVK
ncbi:BsuPI-related putative proteinase inhibitor [Cytobacillus sp. FJAT-54145]|uniref:Intracellular proteinase inhibitor BsuPI domain-containing protein n=1 Tax=Cytobacillus spartinae TaxID=3299023 RepID=A0ABW6KDW0_9BACI